MSELEKTIKDLQKRFDDPDFISYYNKQECEKISFGIMALDLISGGGFPLGKICMLYGGESSSKSTASLCTIASFQKAGKKVALLDCEDSFDESWATRFGVNVKDVLYTNKPQTLEEVSDTIIPLIATNEIDLIVIDSIIALPSQAELEASSEKKFMGGKAKDIGSLMGKILARKRETNTSILIINQLREKISGYGISTYSPGGHQLRHGCDLIIEFRSKDWLEPKDSPPGIKIWCRAMKNRVGAPLQSNEYDLYYEGRIDNTATLLKEAIRLGLIQKSGSWYTYKEQRLQGLENLFNSLPKEEQKKLQGLVLKEIIK